MSRPALTEVDIDSVEKKALVMTMAEGQWNLLLSEAYKTGWTLLELVDGKAVRAYRKTP